MKLALGTNWTLSSLAGGTAV